MVSWPDEIFFWAPLALGDFPARTGAFLAGAAIFLAGCFLETLAAFLAGFARGALAFGCEDFFAFTFALAGFFKVFFFRELAIFSGAPLVSRARAEAYLRAFLRWRKKSFTREKRANRGQILPRIYELALE
jgi:hypothetical protein